MNFVYNYGKGCLFFVLMLITFNSKVESLSQTEAHFKVNEFMINKLYKFENNAFYKDLFNRIVEKERQYNNHYAFYNATNNIWRIPQDLYLRLYSVLNNININPEEFRFFRWGKLTDQTPDQFITKIMFQDGLINDNTDHVKYDIISTNIAFFGNTGFSGESTLQFFLKPKTKTKVKEDTIKSVLDVFNNRSKYKVPSLALYKYIPKIMDLDRYLDAKAIDGGLTPETLVQILVPRAIADEVAYLSWIRGNPYNRKLVMYVFEKIGVNSLTKPLPPFKLIRGTIYKTLDELGAQFKKEKEKNALFEEIIQGVQEGKYKISRALELYKANHDILPDANYWQARILITPKYMNNVNSGIKVFTYDGLTSDQKQQYNQALNSIVQDIVKDLTGEIPITSVRPSQVITPQQITTPQIEKESATLTDEERRLELERIIRQYS